VSAAPTRGVGASLLSEVRQQLTEAAASMDTALRASAASVGIARHDATAAAFHTADGALLAAGRDSHPLLLEAAGEALRGLDGGVAEALRPGDLLATNDPRAGAPGVEDLVVASPVLAEGRVRFLVSLTASHLALGRATLAPVDGLRREGLLLPWTRIGRGDLVAPEILALLSANAEAPPDFTQDLVAQLHALRLGRGALEDLLDRLGPEPVLAASDALRLACRPALARLLAGIEAEVLRGHAGRIAVELRPQEAEAGIAVMSDAEACLSPAQAAAAVRAAVRQVLAVETPSLAVLGDLADSVRLALPANWSAPSPTAEGRLVLAHDLAAAVLAAFADAVPHMAHAPDAGCPLLDLRGVRADGRTYRLRLGLGAGLGASVFGDGLTHAGPAFAPLHLASIEEIERSAPLRVRSHALLSDSAGPGQYHGGLGSRLEFTLLEGRARADLLVPGRASGLRGGMRGTPGRVRHLTPEDGTREIEGPARLSLELRAGHRLTLESPGGGGWGIPFQRSMMRLDEDLLRGLITPEQAKNRYGLVVKPGTLEKDAHLTYRIRHYLLSTLAVEDIVAGEELLD